MLLLYILGVCITYIFFVLKIIEFMFSDIECHKRKKYSMSLLLAIGIISIYISKFIKNKKIKYGINIAGVLIFVYILLNNKSKEINILMSWILLCSMIWISMKNKKKRTKKIITQNNISILS